MSPVATRVMSPTQVRPDQVETLYNTAVQSFIRRDHARTHDTLARLLALLSAGPSGTPWHDFAAPAQHSSNQPAESTKEASERTEWTVKALKLYISVLATLYADPPKPVPQLDHNPSSVLPPAPPNLLLDHALETCLRTYNGTSSGHPHLLPPTLMSTIILAALKLEPEEPALLFAHRTVEDWILALPDAFVLAISQAHATHAVTAEQRRRVESAREGYLKVVELFVGEILCREGEWEMARGFLESESVLSIKRKEVLYKHIRASQQAREHPTSPAASGILPTLADSGHLPDVAPSPVTANGKHRSSSSSTSSSSSEATARPTHTLPTPTTPRAHGRVPSSLRKQESATDPLKAQAQPEAGPSRAPRHARQPSRLDNVFALIPAPLARTIPLERVRHWLQSDWVRQLALPVPVVIVIAIMLRRRARSGALRTADVHDRLRRARRETVREWLVWWLRWWWKKLVGVWVMGTTITYV